MNQWDNKYNMTTISSIKSEALKLRKQGKSYNEINNLLKIPKSTLSDWLKNYPLSEQIKQKNIQKAKLVWAKNIIAFNKRRSEKYKVKTKLLIEKYSKEVPKVFDRDLFFTGLALFWAEGAKREKFSVRFVNSDPLIVKVIMKFFRKICKAPDKQFRLSIHLHQNISEYEAKNFWAETTKLPKEQFRKSQTQISKASKRKRPFNQLPYGTLHIIINDTSLNKKIKGWILGLSKQFNIMPG